MIPLTREEAALCVVVSASAWSTQIARLARAEARAREAIEQLFIERDVAQLAEDLHRTAVHHYYDNLWPAPRVDTWPVDG